MAFPFGGGGGIGTQDATAAFEGGKDDVGESRTILEREGIALNILTKAPYIICSSINRAELNKSRQERVMNSSDEIDRLVLKALNASWNGSTEE